MHLPLSKHITGELPPYSNTEFVFEDGTYRIGTSGDDILTLDGLLGGMIDGGDGEDRVTYTGSELVYDQKNGAMWNEEGTSHDTLKNIETVIAANDNEWCFLSKAV